jgi:hypothetical protein
VKKIVILIFLIVCGVNHALSSSLLFKLTKEVTTEDLFELSGFDATKYRQIRIGIKVELPAIKASDDEYSAKVQRRAILTSKLEAMRKVYSDRMPDVIATKAEIEMIDNEISNYKDAAATSVVKILGIESNEEISLFDFSEKNLNRSIVIDSPPSKISVKVQGKGKYTLYIWGQ